MKRINTQSINTLMVGILAVLIFTAALPAQIIKQIPASALVVVKITNITATNKKLIDFFSAVGASEAAPGLKDPLQYVKDKYGLNDGINPNGDFALAMLDWTAYQTTSDKAVVMLIPVSDYGKFIGNFPGAAKDGNVTVASIGEENPTKAYIAHWGDYAAVSAVEAIVAQPPTDVVQVQGVTAKELDGKDIVILANMKAVRDKVLPQIEGGRAKIAQLIDQAIQSGSLTVPGANFDAAKLAPVIKAVVNQVMGGTERFISDSRFVSIGFNLTPDGIAATFQADFDPDSYLGKCALQIKNTNGPLLTGLPDQKYLFLGGGVVDPKVTGPLVDDMLAPIEKAVADLGPDGASVSGIIANMKLAVTAETGYAAGIIAPSGQIGKVPLMQIAAIYSGDAKTLHDVTRKSMESMDAFTQYMNGATGGVTKTTFTQDSKTLDGFTFDELHMFTDPAAVPGQSQQAAAQIMAMNYMYGPDGLHEYYGVINDNTLLAVGGLDDTEISSIIDTIKAQTSPAEQQDQIKNTASKLPADRIAAFYLPVGQWFITGLDYAKIEGFPTGVQFPEGLDPIGVTISADGSAVRCDEYVPMKLIQAAVSTVMQIEMSQQQRRTGPGL